MRPATAPRGQALVLRKCIVVASPARVNMSSHKRLRRVATEPSEEGRLKAKRHSLTERRVLAHFTTTSIAAHLVGPQI
jgi:hypothetical protein